ncbi:hypothetical protein ACVGVM_10040 [Pseudonocardia bannensis]|uniref:DUF2202 domain-containing protein n=1 Tax=Pseudonocardia bannensis TaxID=630973 RepID=A0A848DQH9_9PSEU|nr:hypothetical protein [Pseudonocardia bannensis]NMH95110.1 hypothetical protein [Pseudonocardia bannensis]
MAQSVSAQPGTPARGLRRAILIAVLVSGLSAACGQDAGSSAGSGASTSVPTAATSGPAGTDLRTMLTRAVEEERGAKTTYDNVVAALGPIAPFPMIAQSEAQHIAELEAVPAAHGIVLPTTAAQGQPAPSTRADACAVGVATEQADVALYDELIPQVQAYPDVVRVLAGLRAASQHNHLPAFQRCA